MNRTNKLLMSSLIIVTGTIAAMEMETVPLFTITTRAAVRDDRKNIIDFIRKTGSYSQFLQSPEELTDTHLCKKKHDTCLGWTLAGELLAVDEQNKIRGVLLYSIDHEKFFCIDLGINTTIALLAVDKEHDSNEYPAALLSTLQEISQQKCATKIKCLHPDENTLKILQTNGFNTHDDYFIEKIIGTTP